MFLEGLVSIVGMLLFWIVSYLIAFGLIRLGIEGVREYRIEREYYINAVNKIREENGKGLRKY